MERLFLEKNKFKHKNERIKLIMKNMFWGFAILNELNIKNEYYSFLGDGKLHQI